MGRVQTAMFVIVGWLAAPSVVYATSGRAPSAAVRGLNMIADFITGPLSFVGGIVFLAMWGVSIWLRGKSFEDAGGGLVMFAFVWGALISFGPDFLRLLGVSSAVLP